MHLKTLSIVSFFLFLTSVFSIVYFAIDYKYTTAQQGLYEVNAGATITIGETRISVEVVDTILKRSKGLSGRKSLSEGTGMFFVMDTVARHGIWMPDMHFAIDIIWLDENMRVVDIKENATPESYPEVFKPEKPARYVLEVPAGFSKKYNVQEGSKAKFEMLAR